MNNDLWREDIELPHVSLYKHLKLAVNDIVQRTQAMQKCEMLMENYFLT